MQSHSGPDGLSWQTSVWDRMAQVYGRGVDPRFVPVVEHVIQRARLTAGLDVLDLGTGTGAVARRASTLVGPTGHGLGIDISLDMLAQARQWAVEAGVQNVELREGRAQAIPAADRTFDTALASLSLMYVIDRGSAAREIARVLRPGGRFVGAVWAGPEQCDLV